MKGVKISAFMDFTFKWETENKQWDFQRDVLSKDVKYVTYDTCAVKKQSRMR